MFAVFVLQVLSLSTERSQRHLLKMLKYDLIVQTPSNSCSSRVRTHTLFTFLKTVFRLAMATSSDFHSSRSVQCIFRREVHMHKGALGNALHSTGEERAGTRVRSKVAFSPRECGKNSACLPAVERSQL